MLLPKNLRPSSTRAAYSLAARMLAKRFVPVIQPSFFIVGAQKCGTTSLSNYLSKHPEISAPYAKELRFFHLDYHFNKGRAHYLSLFPTIKFGKPSAKHSFDATPEYLYYPKAASRIHHMFPESRIVVVLRDPVGRAYSAWNMYCKLAKQPGLPFLTNPYTPEQKAIAALFFDQPAPSFSRILDKEFEIIEEDRVCLEPGLVRRGLYADQIERFHQAFGRDRVLVLLLNELQETGPGLGKLSKFLEIGYEKSLGPFPHSHSRQYPKSIDSRDLERLNCFYRPHHERLESLLNRSIRWCEA